MSLSYPCSTWKQQFIWFKFMVFQILLVLISMNLPWRTASLQLFYRIIQYKDFPHIMMGMKHGVVSMVTGPFLNLCEVKGDIDEESICFRMVCHLVWQCFHCMHPTLFNGFGSLPQVYDLVMTHWDWQKIVTAELLCAECFQRHPRFVVI